MDCQFCTPLPTGAHQPGCPVLDELLVGGGVPADAQMRECTCQQMPHRADCMVKTGTRPAKQDSGAIDVDVCGCLAMLRGEANAWLAEAVTVDARTQDVFLGHARYLLGLIERAVERHALQAVLTPAPVAGPDLKALLTRALDEYLSGLCDAGSDDHGNPGWQSDDLQAFCAEIRRAVA